MPDLMPGFVYGPTLTEVKARIDAAARGGAPPFEPDEIEELADTYMRAQGWAPPWYDNRDLLGEAMLYQSERRASC